MTAWAFLLLAGAVALDLLANALLKRSDGWRRPLPGLAALAAVLLAFSLLGRTLGDIPVAVAYATWGGLGILCTALLSRWLDGTRLSPAAWTGMALIVVGVGVLSGLG